MGVTTVSLQIHFLHTILQGYVLQKFDSLKIQPEQPLAEIWMKLLKFEVNTLR